jgi:hypothetical protein
MAHQQFPMLSEWDHPALDFEVEAFLSDIGFGFGFLGPDPTPTSPTTPTPPLLDVTTTTTTTTTTATATTTSAATAATPPEEDTSASAPSLSAAVPANNDELAERRLRRRISNRESARRSRSRKQRHMEELRGRAARLRAGNRDLAALLRGVQARAAVVRLTNARLHAEAGALARRLAAASRALALRQIYTASGSAGGPGAGSGTVGFFELQALASLIA